MASRNLCCLFKNKLQHTPLKKSQRERVIFKINAKNFSNMSPAVKKYIEDKPNIFQNTFCNLKIFQVFFPPKVNL